MATVTPGTTFISGETVTPAKLNAAATPVVTLNDGEVTDAKLASGIDASKLTSGTLPIARIANGSVTAEKLATGAATPAGAVMPFAMDSAPSGWLAANGDAVSRSTYADLFSAIGTTHGAGNGSTTFNLPDLRGIFVRGSGSQEISGTTYSKSFATKERDAFQAHKHTLRTRNSFGGDTDYVSREAGGNTIVTANAMVGYAADGSNGTPRTATETRPANIALLYCIKF
jgi:microcystin-dependent protein